MGDNNLSMTLDMSNMDWNVGDVCTISDIIRNKYKYKYILTGDTIEDILDKLPITEIENYIRKEKLKFLVDNSI